MSQDRELVTIAIGGYGVLAATQWANGLSQFEVENSNCTFQELGSRRSTLTGSGPCAKAVRAVFLDQSHSSSIKEEKKLNEFYDGVRQLDEKRVNHPPIFGNKNKNSNNSAGDVMSIFGKSGRNTTQYLWSQQQQQKSQKQRRQGKNDDDDDEEEEEEEEEEDEEDSRNENDSSGDDDNDAERKAKDDDTVNYIARSVVKQAHRSRRAGYEQQRERDQQMHHSPLQDAHHPSWQFLAAPHHRDLDRVVSFADFSQRSDKGGYAQMRSFGFGLFDREVHSHIESSTSFIDNLRKEVEASDRLQGVQVFVDADSAFGGIATHVISDVLGDEFGIRRCFTNSCFPDTGGEGADLAGATKSNKSKRDYALLSGGDPFGGMPRETMEMLFEDHRNLNRGLATSYLSRASAAYIPHEATSWAPFFHQTGPQRMLPGLDTTNDVATAAIVANWSDTLLMPCRGVVISGDSADHDAVAVTGGAGVAGAISGRGTFDLPSLMELLRPSPSLRVSAAFQALPFITLDPAHAFPSTNDTESSSSSSRQYQSQSQKRQQQQQQQHDLPALLYNLLNSSAPLLNFNAGNFKPLSGIIVDTSLVDTNAHAVVAHAFCIRAGLPFSESNNRLAMRDAMMNYTTQLRSPSFVGFAVREPSPLSGTFPRSIFMPPHREEEAAASNNNNNSKKDGDEGGAQEQHEDEEAKKRLERDRAGRVALRTRIENLRAVSCGAHAVTTHAAGTYLNSVYQGSLRKAMNLRGEHTKASEMCVDGDTWRELEEDLAALRDTYYYEDPSHFEGDDDD